MQRSKEEVIVGIRACLISTKTKVTLRQLDSDYRSIVGEHIPYRKLGFKSLEDFIQSEPTLCLSKCGSDTYISAKSSSKSAHITEMVSKQKTTKKPSKPNFHYSAPRFNRPNPQPQRWRPKNFSAMPVKWKQPSRPREVAHNQFLERNNFRTTVYPGVTSKTDDTHRNNFVAPLTVQNRLRVDVKPEQNGVKDLHNIEQQNSLVSARKRIARQMSDLKINDRSTIENISPKSPSKYPEFNRTGEPIDDLKSFLEIYQLGEMEMSIIQIKSKKHEVMWTCTIKIGNNSYRSYPNEFKTSTAAQMYAAEEALKDLTSKYENRKQPLLVSSDIDILHRIPPMLEKHNYGIWLGQLKMDYVDKFNEELPSDFLKIIDASPVVQVEKCLGDYVLRHCKQGDKGKMSSVMTAPMVSVPSNTIQVNPDNKLFAMVTCAMSANEIWCRQCDTEESVKYSNMMLMLESYYSKNEGSLRPKSVISGGYYVAKLDENYYRVRALDVTENEVNCFFIDSGDETVISSEDIFELRREFAVAQAQAFVCHLVGLEELYEASMYSESLQKFVYKQVILEIASDNQLYDMLESNVPVYMYDYETEISINQQLIPLLMLESAAPVLKQNVINEVFVSNIEPNGDIYVQVHSPGYETLQTLLKNIEEQIINNPPVELLSRKITKENSRNKLFLGKYELDNHWYRIKLIDWSPDNCYAQTYYVDYGNTGTVDIRNHQLYPIDALNEVLDQYPAQAVRVKMDLNDIPSDFVELAKSIMPSEDPVLLKITGEDIEGYYRAEFFKRNEDGGLFCINKSIAIQSELKKGDGNNNLKNVKRKLGPNIPSAGTLLKPILPKKGEYFEVHVPFAVNPYNFFVQPFESRPKLYKMMEKLQDTYVNVQYSPLQLDQIVPGNIYASKHDDGIWYRTSVIKVINSGSISVFYCDFGYYASLTVKQLLPLDAEFTELPYQALKAKLSDIKPLQSKWTMEDCQTFSEIVTKKNFYSVLLDIERDALYESDIILKLILIDTSSDKDVYIGKELISKGIAVES